MFARPIELGSGRQLDVAAVEPRMHSVAIEFDLVQPVRPSGASLTNSVSCGLIHAGKSARSSDTADLTVTPATSAQLPAL